MRIRLNKYLAQCGIASRRGCDILIRDGKVFVNQEQVKELGVEIDPDQDNVTYLDQRVLVSKKRYFLFNKPVGILTTNSDPFHRPHIGDFLTDVHERLFSIGRLDADSEGLLILTNDGDVAHRLQHPKYKIPKTYQVWIDRELSAKEQRMFQSGILLEEGKTRPAMIRRVGEKEYRIILKQGWKRQIRRMIAQLGAQVVRLKRIAIGDFRLEGLPLGKKKEISFDIFWEKIEKN